MKKLLFAVLMMCVLAVPAMAKTTIDLTGLGQSQFKEFSETFGTALSYHPLAAAAPLGDKLPGFDVGVEASYVKLDKNASWFQQMDAVGELPDALIIPRVHIQVGLPVFPIDLGVIYASIPSSDIKLTGYEVKYAVLEGGVATPALAIRGAYTKLSGVDQVDLTTMSLDLSISKGILIFTPYAGVGEVWITSEPQGAFATILKKEDITETKFFVGSKVKIFPFINLVVEGSFATENVYSARLNVNF
jgi:hypothetical protein